MCKEDWSEYFSTIHSAAAEGDLEEVKYLVETLGVDINAFNRGGETALYHAVDRGHLTIVKYLVAHGACINKVDFANNTALHCAVLRDNIKVIECLVMLGADVNAQNNHSGKVLHNAIFSGNLRTIKYLVGEQGAIVHSSMRDSAVKNKLEITNYLLAHVADVNAAESRGGAGAGADEYGVLAGAHDPHNDTWHND